MAGRISRSFIDNLISRVDIVEVIDARVPLKKAGREYEACCPFHHEKTPSFKVNQQKQFYHCFGCKAGGSAITFLMEYDHLDFVEAIEELAKHIGVEIEYEEGGHFDPQQQRANKEVKTNLYDIMADCDRFYRQQLRQHPKASFAVDYLKSRGLSGEVAKRYNIGYAPPGNNLLGGIRAQADALVTTGMMIRKDNGEVYDRFRHRIMFPIRDSRGRVIAFGGRVIPEEDGSTQSSNPGAKYMNSPETPLFHKGQELYGLYEVRQALRDIPRLLVVEGYMDVIALAQQDINYAVASLGTACTAEHVKKLFRLSQDIVFCFDGDRAGHEAAWRALENSLPVLQGAQQIRFLFLPDGEDPDSMVRKIGKQAFEKKIDQAQSLSHYFFDHLREGISRTDLEGHRTLIERAKPYLKQLADDAYKALLVKELSGYTQKDERELFGLLGLQLQNPLPGPQSHRPGNLAGTAQLPPSLVRTALRCLLYHPPLAQSIEQTGSLSQIDQPGIGLLIDLLEILKTNPTLTTAALLERWRGTVEGQHLAKLATWEPTLNDPESLQQEFLGAIDRLQAQHLSTRTQSLLAKANQNMLTSEEKTELQALLSRNECKNPV